MNPTDLLESTALWLARHALAAILPALLIGLIWWRRWATPRVRWLLALALLARLVTPGLPGLGWSLVWEMPEQPAATEALFAMGVVGESEASASAAAQSIAGSAAPAWWAMTWAAGVLLLGAWWLMGVLRVNCLIARNRAAAPRWVSRLLAEEAAAIGLRSPPELCALHGAGQAAVHGMVSPRLLLPVDWIQNLTEPELRAVLRHELAHVRRRDVLWSTLGFAVAALHWFHPLGWLALRRLRAEAELLCDEAALTGHDEAGRRHYGHVLVRMIESFSPPPPQAVAAFARQRNDIQHRILMIAQPLRHQRWSRALAWLILPVLSLALLTAEERGKEGQRDGEVRKEGPRDGAVRKEGERDGDRPREGVRDGDRPKEGTRDGDRPREGARGDGDRPKEGARDRDRPKEGMRDGDRPKEGTRDGDRPKEGAREGDRPRETMREGDRPREGAARTGDSARRTGSTAPSSATPPMVLKLNARGDIVNGAGAAVPDAEVRQKLQQILATNPDQIFTIEGEQTTTYQSMVRVLNLVQDLGGRDVRLGGAK